MSSTAGPLGASSYSRQIALNVAIASRLQGLGVSLDLNLPQICVLGSQSAGKSSLIESISTIALPRASGTCTRCPTECTMIRSSEAWRCDVYLRFKYDAHGQPLSVQKQIPFGSTIYEREEVKDRVARAQLAILNPNLEDANFPASFLTSSGPDTSAISFSRNVIVLKVSGPEVVDLSFVDLPGLVATTVRGGHADDVRSVRELACEYVKNENAIILLTVTCETDADNQGAYELVKEYDPEGLRTIGVTTKPDRIETGQEDTWFKFLRNTVMHVDNDWYCVKLPGPDQLRQKITWEAARQHEVDFFRKAPWADQVDLKGRYGVPSLTGKLSILLSESIARTLPGILKEIESHLLETQSLLNALPKPPADDAVQAVMHLVWQFERQVDREIAGTPDHGGLVQKINAHANAFRKAIRGTAPIFIPFRPDVEHSTYHYIPTINFLSFEERDLGSSSMNPVLYLTDVELRARESISRELPNNVPFAVKKEMIQKFIDLWAPIHESFVTEGDKTVDRHFAAISRQHFSQYPSLLRMVSADALLPTALRANAWPGFTIWSAHATFTLNTHYLEDYRHKFEALFRSLRYWHKDEGSIVRRLTPNSQAEEPPSNADAASEVGEEYEEEETDAQRRNRLLAKLQAGDSTVAQELLPLLPPDDGNLAIQIMADVRGYWQVVFKRFVDYVALAVDMEYVRAFGKDLGPALFHDLGISGPNAKAVCSRYIAEPHEVATERENLSTKLARFQEAQQAIEDWMAGSNVNLA